MKKSWYPLVISSIGWCVLLLLDFLQVDYAANVSASLKLLLTTTLAVGVAIPFVETALKEGAGTVASTLQPEVKAGFNQVVNAIEGFDLSADAREIKDYLPYQLKYLEFKKSMLIEPEGHGVSTQEFLLKNISDHEVAEVVLPIFGFDIGNHIDDKPYDELLELSINGEPQAISISALRTLSIRSNLPTDYHRTTHMAECCYRIPITLNPRETARIFLKVRNKFAFESMEEWEYLGARIYDITDRLIIEIEPPNNRRIEVFTDTQNSKGIAVFNIMSSDRKQSEINRLPPPKSIKGKRLYWRVEKPLIGHAYAVSFNVTK